MKADAERIYKAAIKECLPDATVKKFLEGFCFPKGKLILVAIGKAAWRMASCAMSEIGGRVDKGIVITKYGHAEGEIPKLEIYEAAHPVPDENGIRATERVLELTDSLTESDAVLFLVSGGGSALFESPKCTLSELENLTRVLLSSGASINEMNAVRKHISKVKGGRFAEHLRPAKVFSVILSDVLGDSLDTIASGPAAPDTSTVSDVFSIINKYSLNVSGNIKAMLSEETPKELDNSVSFVGGSVSELCIAAMYECERLGYKAEILSDGVTSEARDAGALLAQKALEKIDTDIPLALIIGGETVVKVKGCGKGGRNQELVLSAVKKISGHNIAIFSIGSDGTDGPTDAAGAYADGETFAKMQRLGINPDLHLENNDAYNAFMPIDSLIFTGATGTNVNDVSVALIKPK